VSERGRFIALEGLDGSGKTTQARLLAEAVGALLTAEPGATELGTRLRALLLDPASPPVSMRAEALLLAADRAQHVTEVVAPALEAGRWVVSDRFSGSTLAYQGFGRGLDIDELRRLAGWASDGLTPDLTVLVDVPVEEARRRRRPGTADRLERLGDAFQERVRAGYLALAAFDPNGWVVVEGTGDVSEVAGRILEVVTARLAPLPAPAR
jgi:dTMP kinase